MGTLRESNGGGAHTQNALGHGSMFSSLKRGAAIACAAVMLSSFLGPVSAGQRGADYNSNRVVASTHVSAAKTDASKSSIKDVHGAPGKMEIKQRAIKPENRKGLFVYYYDFLTQNGKMNFDGALNKARGAGFNIILPETIDSTGYATYRNSIVAQDPLIFKEWNSKSDPMKMLIEQAAKRNMQVWPWVEVFVGNKTLYKEHINWFATTQSGYRSSKYLDFLNKDVRTYELSILKDIVKRYNVAGINLDIELPVPYVSYSSTDLKLFAKENGISGNVSIGDIEYGGRYNGKWVKWTNDTLTYFLAHVHKKLHEENKNLLVSYDVTSTPNEGYYYERWNLWVNAGAVDVVNPMLYWRDYRFNVRDVYQKTQSEIRTVKANNKNADVTSVIGGSINSTYGMSAGEWKKGLQEALRGGSDGAFVFAYICVEKDDAWRSLHSAFDGIPKHAYIKRRN